MSADTDVAMSQSSWTSSEDTSAEDSCTDEEHDQELFLEAYTAFTTKSEDAGSVESLRRWFSSVERLPDSWPLARLSITLDGLTSQLSKVVMTATMEIIASCRYPDYGLPSLTQLFFFFNRWLQRISRILAVLGYEGIKQATPVVLRPKRKSSAHSL